MVSLRLQQFVRSTNCMGIGKVGYGEKWDLRPNTQDVGWNEDQGGEKEDVSVRIIEDGRRGTDGVAALTAVYKIDKLHSDREGRVHGKRRF